MNPDIPRDTNAIECEKCGGFSPCVGTDSLTKQEINELGCGMGRVCCLEVFICNKCKHRMVRTLESPEADFS